MKKHVTLYGGGEPIATVDTQTGRKYADVVVSNNIDSDTAFPMSAGELRELRKLLKWAIRVVEGEEEA